MFVYLDSRPFGPSPMQHTSNPPTVATTDTLRDLLGLCGTVVSAYVRCNDVSLLTQWLTPSVSPSPNDGSAPRCSFGASAVAPQQDPDAIRQAKTQLLARLQTEPTDVAAWPSRSDGASSRSLQRSLAAFATPTSVHIVPIPFPVDVAISVGATAHLSPLLRGFGPEYAVGLRLSDRSAHLITTFPSAHTSAPDRSARYTLHVSEEPPLASSQSSSLSSMRPLIRWLRAVDDEMGAFLPRRDHPGVLLGPTSLCDAFVTLNLHRTLLQSTDGRVPQRLEASSEQLSTFVRKRAAAFHRTRADSDLRLLHNLHAHRPERFCADEHAIATEAASRRIETLFVDENLLGQRKRCPTMSRTGADATENATVTGDGAVTGPAPVMSANPQTGLSSRIDRTVAETIVAGGTVHTVRGTRLPLGHHIAAIFRY